jgi:predicted MFS family arabinose efflux permease
VISAYTLTFASLVMPAGGLADIYGRKRLLIAGLVIFTASSMVCGAAPTLSILNAARAFQGVGAALQLSTGLATLSHVFRGPVRARAFAFWGSVVGIAIALGPVAGGLITQQFGWEWAFYINIPVGIVMIGLTLYAVTESSDPQATRVDIYGVVSFSTSLFLMTLVLISGNRIGWTSWPIAVETLSAALLFALFTVVESLQARPMLDLRFFSRPTYIGANIAGVAFAACLLTMLTFLPIYFQAGLGYHPQTAGLLMLPMAIPLFIVPRLVASYLAYRLSGRAILTLGLAFIATGLFWIGLNIPASDYQSMLGGMFMAGIGAGLLNGEVAKVGMTVIPPERAGMASGVGGTMRFSGIVVGFAALGAVLVARITSTVNAALPGVSLSDRLPFIRDIAAGDLSGAGEIPLSRSALHALATQSFAQGYQGVLFAAGSFSLLACVASWALVQPSETAPLSRTAGDKPKFIPVE